MNICCVQVSSAGAQAKEALLKQCGASPCLAIIRPIHFLSKLHNTVQVPECYAASNFDLLVSCVCLSLQGSSRQGHTKNDDMSQAET